MRRFFLLLLIGCFVTLLGCDEEGLSLLPSTQTTAFQRLDRFITRFLAENDLPGAAVAVTQDGRLVYAVAFGVANPETGEPYQPSSLSRIGSVSKFITASAILELVEQGRLRLDDTVLGPGGWLSDLPLPSDADPRVTSIRVIDLLTMTSGWDPAAGVDTSSPPTSLAVLAESGTPLPASRDFVIGALAGEPLQFDPGLQYRYLNASPIALALILERVTGLEYAEAVHTLVTRPAGIPAPLVAGSRQIERRLGEVVYAEQILFPSLFPGEGLVPFPYAYGLLDLELIAPTGGMSYSSVDLVRFLAHAAGTRLPEVVDSRLRRGFNTRRPGVETFVGQSFFYGFHTEVFENGAVWGKYGSIPGVAAYVGQLPEGIGVAITVNGRDLTAEELYEPPFAGTTFDADIRNGLRAALRDLPFVPGDRFLDVYPPDRPRFTGIAQASARVGVPFQFQFEAENTQGFTMLDPVPGLALERDTGQWTGTPTQAGRYRVRVVAASTGGRAEAWFTLVVVDAGTPVVEGEGFCPPEAQGVTRDGRIVDEVVMLSQRLVLSPREAIGARVLLHDADGDHVVAEYSGNGALTIEQDDQGRLDLTLGNTDQTSLRLFALGTLNSGEPATGNGFADVRRLIVQGSGLRMLALENARFSGDTGPVGIIASGVTVREGVNFHALQAAGEAQPALLFGNATQFTFMSPDMRQPNGKPVEIRGITEPELYFGSNADGQVLPLRVPECRFVADGIDITDRLFETLAD